LRRARRRFVEQNFGLGTLRTSDAPANSIEDAFDFHQWPIVAAVFALAGRASSNNPGNLYAHSSSLNDITTGNNGNCGPPLCEAGVGWDGPTGLGSPNGIAAF
jgi:hypothetical protein